MLAVIEAFAVIGVVVAVGFAVGRTGVLGGNARMVLNRTAFHVGVPALLLISLADAQLSQVFSTALFISAITAITVFGLYFAIATIALRRGRGEATIGASAGAAVNAGNLGLPLSAYVFGDTTAVSAVILFQYILLVPVSLAILDSESRTEQRSVGRRVLALVTTPIIAASAVGIALALTGTKLPAPLHKPLELLAALAIPTVLLAFGISLSNADDRPPRPHRADFALALVFKLLLMPLIAYSLARWCFDASIEQTMLVTVLAALPAAQNINTYAAVYRRGEGLARDTTLIGTVLSVPIIVAIVALTG